MHDQRLQQDLALWVIRLNCDDPEERAKVQQEFKQWQLEHPESLSYLEQMDAFSNSIQQLTRQHHISAQVAQRTFHAVKKNKQHIHKLFTGSALTISALAITVLLYKAVPFNYYFADYRTVTGQTQHYILSDGSSITLGAKSAIKLNFTAKQRSIELIRGNIYIDVAKDPTRPLVIKTDQANYKALGTRFIVDQLHDRSSITMLHSKVQIHANLADQHDQVIQMGEKTSVNAQGIQTIHPIDLNVVKQAWQQQLIIADNLPLSDILDKLQQHHDTYMIYDRENLAHIKINGVIDSKQDLQLTLKLLKTQYPQLDFVQFGEFVTYARLK